MSNAFVEPREQMVIFNTLLQIMKYTAIYRSLTYGLAIDEQKWIGHDCAYQDPTLLDKTEEKEPLVGRYGVFEHFAAGLHLLSSP